MTTTRCHARPSSDAAHAVSRPHDPAEQQAAKAADVVTRGGKVAGWSFASVADSAVHRQDDGGKPEEEKKKPPDPKTAEADKAVLESPGGKDVQKSVLDVPEVKKAIEFAKTPAGIGLGVGLGAMGLAGLAANHKPLPFQPPAIPLEGIGLKGISAKVEYLGPVDRPTGVGLSLTYTEQGPAKKKAADSEEYRATTQRLQAELGRFRAGLKPAPGTKAAREQQAQDDADRQAIADYVARHSSLPGAGRPLIPATGGPVVITPTPTPATDKPAAGTEQKKPDDTPVQREPATTSEQTAPDTSRIDAALRGSGRPLDPSVRRSMEARFGYDFSQVRLHDDAGANAAAHGVQAAAFTIGSDIVLAAGKLDTRTLVGRRLLAHELAHVVQQAGQAGPVLHRRSVFETIGIWLGLVEGTWDDRELHAYLDGITAADQIDGSYDADNKARAIVRKWKQAAAGYDLRAQQKVLLIAEMLDGPTLGDDEECILDLLERSDAGDLRTIFASNEVTLDQLESDISGGNHDRLEAFLNHRFDGGRDAVARGQVVVVGPPVPAAAPVFGFDPAALDAEIDSDRSTAELVAYVDHLAPADRPRALHYISQVRRPPMQMTLNSYQAQLRQARTNEDKRLARAMLDNHIHFMLKIERVLHHYYGDQVPATSAALQAQTHPVSPQQTAVLQQATRPTTSAAQFNRQLPGETLDYEGKLRAMLPDLVNGYYQRMVTPRPSTTYALTDIEAIGQISKREVDRVFGRFYLSSAPGAPQHEIRADEPGRPGTLIDAYARAADEQSHMSAAGKRFAAVDKLNYLLSADEQVAALNRAHDANPLFNEQRVPQNPEARLQTAAVSDFASDATNQAHLLELVRVWPGAARSDTGEIFVQVDRPPGAEDDRWHRWVLFVTLIHEYIHTVRHPQYTDYARSFGPRSRSYNTLAEGVDSLLTETVWETLAPRLGDRQLRVEIEGTDFAQNLPPLHGNQLYLARGVRYPSYSEALRIVDLVGLPNLLAAYFLGLVDRIGGAVAPPGGPP